MIRFGGDLGEWRSPCGTMVFESLGDGEVVLLVHAPEIAGSRAEWAALAPYLAAGGYRVVAPDLPGFGESDPAAPLTADLLTEALGSFVHQTCGGGCHLVGRGHAAAYLTHLAVQAPARYASLTALLPFGVHPREPDSALYRAMLGDQGLAWREAVAAPEAVALWLGEEVYYDRRFATAARVREVETWIQQAPPETLASLAAGYLHRDVRAEWVEVPQPILLIWGEACEDPPLDDVDDWLMPLRPNAPFMMIDGRPIGIWKQSVTYKSFGPARARPHEEMPDEVAKVLVEHLGRAAEA